MQRLETHILDSPLQAFFGTIPREIVCEVFSWLRPRDLVRLAEVNRELRSLLMSNESLPIWKSARERNWTRIPDCPTDLSELQWARLIFCLQCTICGNEAYEVEWAVRMRVCDQCWTNYFLFQDSYHHMVGKGFYEDQVQLAADYEIAMDLVPACTPRSPWEAQTHRYIAFEPDIEKMARTVQQNRARLVAGASKDQAQELDLFILNRKKWVECASEHARLCREWDPPLALVELREREEGKKRLVAQLIALGYDEGVIGVALLDSDMDLTIGLDEATILQNRAKLEKVVRAVQACQAQG